MGGLGGRYSVSAVWEASRCEHQVRGCGMASKGGRGRILMQWQLMTLRLQNQYYGD